jgi:hypothetical protein
MDILYWTQLNPNIIFGHTTKQYYQRFLYKIVLYAPGGRLLDHKCSTIQAALEHRKQRNTIYNYGGSWRDKYDDHRLRDVDCDFLEVLKQLKFDLGTNVRLRIDEPNIQIYADSEDMLKQVVSRFTQDQLRFIQNITYPANDQTAKLLKAGSILTKNTPVYSHKVMLRDGRYDTQTKQQILNYLENLGDLVKVSNGTKEMLNKPYPSMWGAFFYTNDPNLTAFLSLISPTIILNIHELVVIE